MNMAFHQKTHLKVWQMKTHFLVVKWYENKKGQKSQSKWEAKFPQQKMVLSVTTSKKNLRKRAQATNS